MSAIINGLEFQCANDITFTKPKINASGGKNVGVLNKHTMKGLYINTPLMLTWGINEYKDEVSGKVSYDMSLQFPNEEYNTPELTTFLKNWYANNVTTAIPTRAINAKFPPISGHFTQVGLTRSDEPSEKP